MMREAKMNGRTTTPVPGTTGFLALAFLVCSPLFGANILKASPEPSPILVLYEQRHQMELNELERQKTNLTYTSEMKDRLEPVFASGALPEATIHTVRAEFDLAQLRVKSQESRVNMAQAMIEIAKARLGSGREMPFCSLPQVKELNDADWDMPGLLKGGGR